MFKFLVFGLTATTKVIIALGTGSIIGAGGLKLAQKLSEKKDETVETHTKKTAHSHG